MAIQVKKISSAPIVVLVVLLGGGIFYAQFSVKGFLTERATYASLRSQISDIQNKRGQLILAQTSAQNINGEVARIQNAFVGENDVLSVVLPLEREAASKGITDYTVSVAQDILLPDASRKSSSPLGGTTLRIEGTGTLENLLSFVQDLQSLPYFLRVESFTLQQKAGSTAAPSGSGISPAPLQAIIIVKFFSPPSA